MRQFNVVAGAALMLALSAGAGLPIAYAAEPESLQLEAKILLGDVSGRIDHMAVDLQRKRLFVAELENNSLGIVDLTGHKLIRTVDGFKAPQGVGYVPANDTLYVANGGDGSLRMFEGQNYTAAGQIDLGDDTDNIRVDAAANRVFVSHRGNMVTAIDSAARRKVSDVTLNGNVESFQLDPASKRMFVNLSDQPAIAVVDRDNMQLTATWKLTGARDNYAMTLDPDAKRVLVAFRQPAKLGAISTTDGSVVALLDACADADDMFLDRKRQRVYITCGEGFIDVFDAKGNDYPRLAHIATVPGARTSLLVPDLNLFVVAARAQSGAPAALWIFRPTD
jgi:DNA-binding beta-propeller fold protein YncE